MHDINANKDNGYMGIEPDPLSSAKGQKKRALTTWPRRHFSNRSKGNTETDGITVLLLARK